MPDPKDAKRPYWNAASIEWSIAKAREMQGDIDRLTQELASARAIQPSADDVEWAQRLLTRIFTCGGLCRLPPCQCINDVATALAKARREGTAK